MSKGIAHQLLTDARRGIINKDALLSACLTMLENISEKDLYQMALDEGFVGLNVKEENDPFENELKELDATQRIIEKVLNRHGE